MHLPTLRSLLETTAYPLLALMGRLRGLQIARNLPKAELVTLLLAAFSDLTALAALLDRLAPAERAVLYDLVLAGGRLPRYHLARRHGDFRKFRPWRADCPARPWENPASPTERLYLWGLIFWDPDSGDLLIPAKLLSRYPTPPPPKTNAPLPAATSASALLAQHDLAQLLALLAAEPPRLAHGRWLPPLLLREWGTQCARPPARPDAPGELHAPRRRFLHYLAAATGLVAPVGPVLALTPAAWEWLAASPAARLATLWPAFAAPQSPRWAAFRLPGYRLQIAPTLHAALVRELRRAAQPSWALGRAEDVAGRLLARDPAPCTALGQRVWEPEVVLTQAFTALLTGPLTDLGVVVGGPDLRLTAWGAHLLGLCAAPKTPTPLPFTLGPELTFAPPGLELEPLSLVTLATCAERQTTGDYRIMAASWVRVLHQGESAAALLTRLNTVAQRPLNGAEIATLNVWASAVDRMHIRQLTVLEVTDPDILARLQHSQRGRRLLLHTLGRRAVAVDEGKLPLLVRRLTAQEGVPPRVTVPPAVPPANPALGQGGAALLWLAARVYRVLGEVLPLPVHIPTALLEHLAAQADPGALTSAEGAVQCVRAALQNALAGRTAFPMWGQSTLRVADSLAAIEYALAEGQALALDYYTAGRDEVTHRVVEPYRIEHRSTRHGDEVYLVAFCHRAQAERVFRVDRIRALKLVPLPHDPRDRED